MAKFYGKVGYVQTQMGARGVYSEVATEKYHRGDIIRNSKQTVTEGEVNASLSVSNEISIVADPYALENFHSIRYVEFMNSKWTVTRVNVQYPRLLLTLGGIYNGPAQTESSD